MNKTTPLIPSRISMKVIFFASALVLANSAHAFVSTTPNTVISDSVTQINSTDWSYGYTLTNLTECFGNCGDTIQQKPIIDYWLTLSDFYIPYFSDAGIKNISSPTAWSVTIEVNNDVFNLGNGAGVLHWSTALGQGIPVNGVLSGFGYEANFGPAKAPFQTKLTDGSIFLGDPLIPASPNAILAGLPPVPSQIPVPPTIYLFISGLVALGLKFRKKSLIALRQFSA